MEIPASLIFRVTYIYASIQTLITIAASFFALRTVQTCSFKFWLKTMWKMRNVYSAATVHIFDFATDLLVIGEWIRLENNGKNNNIEHVDTQLLAYCSIGIILFHKIIS